MKTVLELNGINSGWGKVQVLFDLDLSVEEEGIVSLIGPNGAGKSTVLKTVLGLTGWREGKIDFLGKDLMKMGPAEIARAGIAFVHQGRGVFPSLTVEENLDLGAYLMKDKGRVERDKEKVFKMFPMLDEKRHDVAKTMSGGQQQMLALGRAMMLEPKLLMLDEPSLGLAPKIVEEIFEKIKLINKQGITILMVEQNVKKALELSTKVNVLRLGKFEFSGKSLEIMSDHRLKEAYLGK